MRLDHEGTALALDYLLGGSDDDPASIATRNATPITTDLIAAASLPHGLQKLLDDRGTEIGLEDATALHSLMGDFGVRVYRVLLAAGLNHARGLRRVDTDLARQVDTVLQRNRFDTVCARNLLLSLSVEFGNTPLVPKNTVELLSRVANALSETLEGQRPTLFDMPELLRRGQRPAHCEGALAAALQMLVRGGMKLAAARNWLNRQMVTEKLVDEAGNPVTAERVAGWRHNFNNGLGAEDARRSFDQVLDDHRILMRQPLSEAKFATCQQAAARLVRLLAAHFNRTVPPPLVRPKTIKPRPNKKG